MRRPACNGLVAAAVMAAMTVVAPMATVTVAAMMATMNAVAAVVAANAVPCAMACPGRDGARGNSGGDAGDHMAGMVPGLGLLHARPRESGGQDQCGGKHEERFHDDGSFPVAGAPLPRATSRAPSARTARDSAGEETMRHMNVV